MAGIRKLSEIFLPMTVATTVSLVISYSESTPRNEKVSMMLSPNVTKSNGKAGMAGGGDENFEVSFPARQLWIPSKPYPLWDDDWDGKKNERSKLDSKTARFKGVTRHVILIRHGQYVENYEKDGMKKLTELGRKQAHLTGIRLAEMMKGFNDDESIHVKALHVSNLTRAKETADIITEHISGIARTDPDPLLNEGRPCHFLPSGGVNKSMIKKIDEDNPRIEQAFQKYFYAAPFDPNSSTRHEYEIIVCHGNVIRYFFCRALQIPPEAWLRLCTFNCSLTYFTIRPSGSVSCRMVGDIGHLGYDKSTFSMHHGFNW